MSARSALFRLALCAAWSSAAGAIAHAQPSTRPTAAPATTEPAWRPVPFTNGSFEAGIGQWQNRYDKDMSAADTAAAYKGRLGLRVTDKDATNGSDLGSPWQTAVAGRRYQLRFWGRVVEDGACWVYIRFQDAAGKMIDGAQLAVPIAGRDWAQFAGDVPCPADAKKLQVWVHSYGTGVGTFDVDGIELFWAEDK
jgi:hypothetical protein